MALFGLFGNKEKKNLQVNEANKAKILNILTQTQMACKDANAIAVLRKIASQIQAQGESSSEELMTIDGEILKILTDSHAFILKQQYPTAISKLNKAFNLAVDRNQYCMLGGRKTKQDKKLEDQANRVMANVKAAEKTREEELQSRLDELNAEFEAAVNEQAQLKALYEQNPHNASIIGRAKSIQTKIISIKNQINATTIELQKEGQDAAIISNVEFNETLASGRRNDSEMDLARENLKAQNQLRGEMASQLHEDADLLNAGAAGLFDGDPFADPFQDAAATADLFENPFGTQAQASAPSAQTQYGGFDSSTIGTTSMANDIRKARQELEKSIEIFNDKIDDASDELNEYNAELRPLLERRRTASPSDCLTLDGQIDQINAKRNAVINKIKRYRQANAQLVDKLGLLDKLDTQQDLALTNAKIEQLTNGKFADFQGLAMFLNDSVKRSNEELQEIGEASSIADAEDIMMSSASAASAVLSDVGSITKDEHKYDAVEQELGMTI